MRVTILLVGGFLLFITGYSAPAASEEPILDSIRQATDKYQNVKQALADGYMPPRDGKCISAAMEGLPPELGAMGLHYARPDLLGITGDKPRVNGTGTHTDFMKPSILIYEPQADGSLVLVGVENLVFKEAWHEAGNADPPSFMGHPFNLMADDPNTPGDEAHGFEPHYDLHVWLYRENPNGVLSPFNVNVTCEHHKQPHAAHQ